MASAVKLNAALLQPLKFVKGESVSEPQPNTVYVLEFWATWCPPCRDSIPHLSKLQAHYKDQGVVFIGISSEEESVRSHAIARPFSSSSSCSRGWFWCMCVYARVCVYIYVCVCVCVC
jgi:thiol-disulfide isomerase/thioredoxin